MTTSGGGGGAGGAVSQTSMGGSSVDTGGKGAGGSAGGGSGSGVPSSSGPAGSGAAGNSPRSGSSQGGTRTGSQASAAAGSRTDSGTTSGNAASGCSCRILGDGRHGRPSASLVLFLVLASVSLVGKPRRVTLRWPAGPIARQPRDSPSQPEPHGGGTQGPRRSTGHLSTLLGPRSRPVLAARPTRRAAVGGAQGQRRYRLRRAVKPPLSAEVGLRNSGVPSTTAGLGLVR